MAFVLRRIHPRRTAEAAASLSQSKTRNGCASGTLALSQRTLSETAATVMKQLSDLPTREIILALLSYDPLTGVFTWRVNRRGHVKAGDVAGHTRPDGYVYVTIDGKRLYAHRLAYFIMTGTWPEDEIDHVNGDPSYNAWANLRAAFCVENRRNSRTKSNSRSGLKGIVYHKPTNKWHARITVDRKVVPLRYHNTPEEAHAAYCEAAARLHKQFARFK